MAAEAKGGKPPAGRITRPPGAARRGPDGSVHGASAPGRPAVLRLTSEPAGEEEREPLFYIDDAEYTIPVVPVATTGLQATHLLAETRAELIATGMAPLTAANLAMGVAQDYVLREMLGEEGYAALRACKTITGPQLQRLVEVCSEKAMGAMEAPNP